LPTDSRFPPGASKIDPHQLYVDGGFFCWGVCKTLHVEDEFEECEMGENAVKKLVIVGGGTAGWMVAAALSKAFGTTLEISLVESDQISAVGVGEATIPQIHLFNKFLGIDEAEFVKATQATFKLGIEFKNWSSNGDKYLHAFGPIGLPLGFLPFHQYWIRANQEGRSSDLWRYSLNTRAAYDDKFSRIERIGNTPIEGPKYAFHFDAGLYANFLRTISEKAGVTRIEGRVVEVKKDVEAGFISGVLLEDGRSIEGDLFVDCSGFRGLLIERELSSGYEDWSHLLPCDSAVVVPSTRGKRLRPYTQSIAHEAGWQWRIPLQHRTGNGHVFCSEYVSADEAAAKLLDGIEGEALAEPRTLHFTTGKRKKVWIKNCIAMGLASGFMEPLESTSIHMIQTAINRLIAMFPSSKRDMNVAAEYNRQTDYEYETTRDFLIAHYALNSKVDLQFWNDCRDLELPESLKHRIELFEESGRIVRDQEELFTEASWLQLFIGQKKHPKSYHPLVDGIASLKINEFLSNIDNTITQGVEAFSSHDDFILKHYKA